MTQKELAKHIGVHYITITRRLRDIQRPSNWQYDPFSFLEVYDQLRDLSSRKNIKKIPQK
jgi:hypothetical protein